MSKESGIADSLGKSFGAVATDVNNDGLMDLFVANDTMANFLFVNKGRGKFEEVGLASGVAYSDSGSPRSGMGVDATDYDGDGWQDLFVANIDQELFSLYHNQKDLTFTDKPGEIAPGDATVERLGFEVLRLRQRRRPGPDSGQRPPGRHGRDAAAQVKYKEPLLMFENVNGKSSRTSAQSGAVFAKTFRRGLSVGDFDNDGDLDVLDHQQRRAAAAAAQRRREPQQLARAAAGRDEEQSGRGRRGHHVEGRRRPAKPPEDERRQLSRLAR